MKRLLATFVAVMALLISVPVHGEDDHYARGIVIQALKLPNELNVAGREFRTKPNPKGAGVFVYDPRTRFQGVERKLIWLVVRDEAYPLNGASKNLSRTLKWPREADPKVWKSTGIDPYSTQESLAIVFTSE